MDDQETLALTEPEVMYLTPNAPSMTLYLGSEKVQAVNGVLRLDQKQAKRLDELMHNPRSPRPDLTQSIRKVDIAAAEKTARDFLARQRPQAKQGPVTSDDNPLRAMQQANTTVALTGTDNPPVQFQEPVKKQIVELPPAEQKPAKAAGMMAFKKDK